MERIRQSSSPPKRYGSTYTHTHATDLLASNTGAEDKSLSVWQSARPLFSFCHGPGLASAWLS